MTRFLELCSYASYLSDRSVPLLPHRLIAAGAHRSSGGQCTAGAVNKPWWDVSPEAREIPSNMSPRLTVERRRNGWVALG